MNIIVDELLDQTIVMSPPEGVVELTSHSATRVSVEEAPPDAPLVMITLLKAVVVEGAVKVVSLASATPFELVPETGETILVMPIPAPEEKLEPMILDDPTSEVLVWVAEKV